MLTFGRLVRFCLTFEEKTLHFKHLDTFSISEKKYTLNSLYGKKKRNSFPYGQVLLPVWRGPKSGRGICNPRLSCSFCKYLKKWYHVYAVPFEIAVNESTLYLLYTFIHAFINRRLIAIIHMKGCTHSIIWVITFIANAFLNMAAIRW